jgi:hypothetical protein
MKTFELHRDEDATGVSGTGIVAQGVEFDDGTCAIRWIKDRHSTGLYSSMRDVRAIHCHGGTTRIVGTGDPFRRGMTDCYQDRCENCPMASIGGLDARAKPSAPKYITPSEHADYLDGYAHQAQAMYGDDWRTCVFGWQRALQIGGEAEKAREG